MYGDDAECGHPERAHRGGCTETSPLSAGPPACYDLTGMNGPRAERDRPGEASATRMLVAPIRTERLG